MTIPEWVRYLVIGIAVIDIVLYIALGVRNNYVSMRYVTITALIWLIPTAALFIIRIFYRDTAFLNAFSVYTYLAGVSAWLGIGISSLRFSHARKHN